MQDAPEPVSGLIINRRQNIHLYAFDGDGPRFAHLFRETWRLLPLYARLRILCLWRNSADALAHTILRSPNIELLSDWSGRKGRGLRGCLAAVSNHGHQLRFLSRAMDRLPASIVRDVVAHELAHVYQAAVGADWSVHEVLESEMEADELVTDWGFDAKSVDNMMSA